ncbi:hypothetical protein [Pendulispora albinea]|uniref:Uncharacterized protein n=1 Tax=Pendulispora albinea TaxID=2741071 RepID=A0ABZ2LIY6_9BACT
MGQEHGKPAGNKSGAADGGAPVAQIEIEDSLDDLPPLDGDADEADEESDRDRALLEDDELASDTDSQDAIDPFDDSTGEGDPVEELAEEEHSWLTDAEPAEALDLGNLDLQLANDGVLGTVIGDDDEPGIDGEDFGLDDSLQDGRGAVLLDGGEEGPSGPDEELREADLPALDADEDGDLDDAVLDDVALDDDAPLPWDASPWERVPADNAKSFGARAPEQDAESGERTLLRLGLAKMGDLRVTAEATAHDHVLVALVSRIAGRAWLVRVPSAFPRGEARIVAEVGGADFGDDPEILSLAWDDARGVVWVGGLFGLLAFQPHAAPRASV